MKRFRYKLIKTIAKLFLCRELIDQEQYDRVVPFYGDRPIGHQAKIVNLAQAKSYYKHLKAAKLVDNNLKK